MLHLHADLRVQMPKLWFQLRRTGGIRDRGASLSDLWTTRGTGFFADLATWPPAARTEGSRFRVATRRA